MKKSELDDTSDDVLLRALRKLGEGSCFLWMIFIFTMTPPMFNGMHSMSYIFIAEVPTHWCSIPALKAANWTSEQIRNISSATSCTRYDYDYEYFAEIGYDEALRYRDSHELPNATPCKSRDYANDIDGTSLVTDWDLVCDKVAYRSNTHMALSLGKLLGSFMGFFADKYGRKLAYRIGIVLLIISGPASSIIPWYTGFLLLRLTTGISHAAIQYSSFTTLTEVAEEKHRQWMGIAYNAGYAAGTVLLSGIAYAITDWRQLLLATSLPALFLLIHMWYMPESPRWLISQNRRKEAQEIIEKSYGSVYENTNKFSIISVHGRTSPGSEYEINPYEDKTASQQSKVKESIKSFRVLFSHFELRRRAFIAYFAWMTASLSYYALALNVNNFSADHYIYVLVMGLTEIPAYLVPTPLLMLMGRRQASILLYSIASFCLLSILALPTSENMAIMVVALTGRFALSAVYGIVILYTSELFPTVARNSAIGTSSAMSHVGSVAAPYVADLLGAIAWWSPSTLCGILALIAGLLCLMLPETRGRPLSNTVEEELREGRGTVSLRNCCICKS